VTLQAHCALPVRQIDKDPILADASSGARRYHLLVELATSCSPPSLGDGARPSIDVLLESVADVFGDGVVASSWAEGGAPSCDGHAGRRVPRAAAS
jgi:chemotaxis response regulator CheB